MFAHPSDCWLQPLQYHALVTILVRRVDHLLAQLTDYEGVEAILVHFLSLAQYKEVILPMFHTSISLHP